jgi:hypothetical protein
LTLSHAMLLAALPVSRAEAMTERVIVECMTVRTLREQLGQTGDKRRTDR